MKKLTLFAVLSILLVTSFITTHAKEIPLRDITTIHKAYISSSLTSESLDYLTRIAKKIEGSSPEKSMMLIELNTPGGFITTTKQILKLFSKSSFPYVIWVHPKDALIASSGVLMAAGAHYIFMAEGTHFGAGIPTRINDPKTQRQPLNIRDKAIAKLTSLAMNLNQNHQRSAHEAIKLITNTSSITAQQAQSRGLIDGVANNSAQLLRQLNNTEFRALEQNYILKLSDKVNFIDHPLEPVQKFLNIFAHPSVAYIFFLIGAALLYLEIQAPGGFIAGTLGAICLTFSSIGLHILPLNKESLALIIASFLLFILEVFITSFGLLSLSGCAALIWGSTFLYKTDDSYIHFSNSLIVAAVLAIGTFIALCIYSFMKDQKKIGLEKFNSLEDKTGIIINIINKSGPLSPKQYYYQVKIGSEYWQATSTQSLEINENIQIAKHSLETESKKNEMILTIEKA